MGATNSKAKLSGTDFQSNLFWSLEQQMKWQSQCASAQQMLKLNQQQNMMGGGQHMSGVGSNLDITGMDRECDSIITSSYQVLNEVDNIVNGRWFPTVGSLLTRKQSNTHVSSGVANPLHSGLASQLFGAAAAEQVATTSNVSNINTVNTMNTGVGSSVPQSSMGMSPNTNNFWRQMKDNYYSNKQQPIGGSNQLNQFSYFSAADNFDNMQQQRSSHGVQQNSSVLSGVQSGMNNLSMQQQALTQVPQQSNLNTHSGIALDQLSKERIEIAAKYMFIHNLLERFIHSSESNYQMWSKYETLRKRTKAKYSKNIPAQELQMLILERDNLEAMLWSSHNSWSLAQTTLDWLQTDYAIEYALHKVNSQVQRIRSFNDMLFAQHVQSTMSSNVTGTGIPAEAFQVSSVSANIKRYTEQFDEIILKLTQQKILLNGCSINNEKDALRIGFDFLDHKNRGSLEQSDIPSMPEQLFSLLVGKSGNTITYNTMIESLDRLSNELDSLSMKIVDLQRTNGRLYMERLTNTKDPNVHNQTINDNEIQMREQLIRAQEIRLQLRQIYRFFLDAFSMHVFATLDSPLRQQSIDVNLLFNDLRDVDTTRSFMNPFTPVPGMENDIDDKEEVFLDQKNMGMQQKTMVGQAQPNTMASMTGLTDIAPKTTYEQVPIVNPSNVAIDMPSQGVFNKDVRSDVSTVRKDSDPLQQGVGRTNV